MVAATLLAPLGQLTAAFSEQDKSDDRTHRIEITGLDPLVLRAGSPLKLTGTLTNLTQRATQNITLQAEVAEPLKGRSQLPTIGSVKALVGARALPIERQSLLGDLAPGQTKSFTISISPEALALKSEGVYPIRVSLFSESKLLDETTLTLPWMPETRTNLSAAVLWPITAPPAQSDADTAFTNLLPEQMGQQGPLRAVLENSQPRFSLLIDPAISDFALAASDGYFVTDGEGFKVGTEGDAIANWSQTLLAASQTSETWLTPYANPELGPRFRGRLAELIDNSYRLSKTQSTSSQFQPEGVVTRINNKFDEEELIELARRSEVIVLGSKLLRPVTTSNFTRGARISWESLGLTDTETPLLIADSQLTNAFVPYSNTSGISDQAMAVLVRQQIASELTMLALEQPSKSALVVATPPATWSPSASMSAAAAEALAQGPWVRVITLSQAAAFPPVTDPYLNDSPDKAAKSETLRPRQIELLKEGAATVAQLASIVTGPSKSLENLTLGLNRGISQYWIKRAKIGRELATNVNQQIYETYFGVSVVTSPDLTLTGQLGALPVTITNSLDVPIRVSLATSPILGAQVDIASAQNLTVPGEQSLAVDVPIEIQGSTPNQIDLYLVNDSGERVGNGAIVQIRTTAYSQFAQWISVVSLALLIVLASVSLSRKMRKSQRKNMA